MSRVRIGRSGELLVEKGRYLALLHDPSGLIRWALRQEAQVRPIKEKKP